MENCFLFSKQLFQMYMAVRTLLKRTSTLIEEELNTELIDHFSQSGHFSFHYCNTLFKDLRSRYFLFLISEMNEQKNYF